MQQTAGYGLYKGLHLQGSHTGHEAVRGWALCRAGGDRLCVEGVPESGISVAEDFGRLGVWRDPGRRDGAGEDHSGDQRSAGHSGKERKRRGFGRTD